MFWVAPSSPYYIDGRSYDAADENDGLSPERALLTVARGLTLAGISANTGASISNTGEVVMLLPGTHTVTAQVRMQTAGVTLTGLPVNKTDQPPSFAGPAKPAAVLTSTGTNQNLLSIEASNIEVANLTLRPTAGFAAVVFRNQPTVDNLSIHDCVVDLFTPTVNANTTGIDFANRADSATTPPGSYSTKAGTGTPVIATVYVDRVTFWARDGVGRGVECATVSGVIRNCHFLHGQAGTWGTPFMVATNTRELLVDNCIWTTGGTMAVCVDGSSAGTTTLRAMFTRCLFPATTTSTAPINRTTANVIQTTQCYQGGGAGGVAVNTAGVAIPTSPVTVL